MKDKAFGTRLPNLYFTGYYFNYIMIFSFRNYKESMILRRKNNAIVKYKNTFVLLNTKKRA